MAINTTGKPKLKIYQHYAKIQGRVRRSKTSMGSFSLDGKCAYIIYDYSPLRKTMYEMGIKKMADLQRLTGISGNTTADISMGRALSLDTIAVICYGLQCRLCDVLKFRFVEASVVDVITTGVPQKFGPEMLIDFDKKEEERAKQMIEDEKIKPKNILFD